MNTSTRVRLSDQEPEILIPRPMTDDWLDRRTLQSLTVAQIVARVDALKPLIAANAREAELQRRPVDEVWAALRRTGVFYLYVPKKYGGLEAGGLQALIDVVTSIAESCTSTAWCACFSVYHQWVVAQFPEKFQEEMWRAYPYFTSAGSGGPTGVAVKVEGGYRLKGRWKWGSGIMHSEWVNTAAMVTGEDGQKQPYFFFLPVEQATVLDTWYVDGMCGTGSHDYTIDDVFVPEHRSIKISTLMNGQSGHANPFYRIPMAPTFALTVLVPALGAARGAVARFKDRLASGGAGGAPLDKPLSQECWAKAAMDVTAAELITREASRELEALSARDDKVSLEDRVRIRTHYSYALDLCRKAVRLLNDQGGSSAHYLSNPAQRPLRDITVIATHAVVDFVPAMELYGRIMTGLSSNNDWFR